MTKAQLLQLLKPEIELSRQGFRQGLTCTYCPRPLDPPGTNSLLEATKDHPWPKSRKGHGITVWACYHCNNIKGNMPWQAWVSFTEAHPNWWEKPKFAVTRGPGATQPKKKRIMENNNTITDNVVAFRQPSNIRLLTGGKPPSTGNWLLDLPIGARFTVSAKNDPKNFMCLDLEMVNKTPRCAVLWELSSGQPLGGTGRVVAARFTMQFDKVEDLPSYDDMMEEAALKDSPQEETTETTNGDNNRTAGDSTSGS